jgi:PmbA protein
MIEQSLIEAARRVVELARRKGAQEVAASAGRARNVDIEWRDGRLEKITEATTRGVGVQLYVDGRYSSLSTSDLRPEAVDKFLTDAVALTRALAPDPYRRLPEPELYQGRASLDLQLEDKRYDAVSPQARRQRAEQIEAAARDVKGREAILSVTSSVGDTLYESARVHSNGFEGQHRSTAFWAGAQVSVKDQDGRRPEEYFYAAGRHDSALPGVVEIGHRAGERAVRRLGTQKLPSAVLPMVVDNAVAGGLLGRLLGPMHAASLQQKRSFFEGKLGQPMGSALLDLTDDPLVVRGLASRLWDGEGIAARPMPLFEAGVLRNIYVDTYYGRKLGMRPTTGSGSNLRWKLGGKGQAELIADAGEGVFVTGFLGGNSNGTTGDFSLGVQGFRIRGGKVAEPVGEINIAGNHLELWKRLAAVGNDPYPFSSGRTPTLVFDGVQFAGV